MKPALKRFWLPASFAIVAALPITVAATAPETAEPILASTEQDEAEGRLLELLRDPEVLSTQARLRRELARSPIGRTRDGAATLERAIGCLTNSLVMKEIATYRSRPAILWTTEDTPREWRGRAIGCTGTAGDNPDNIYRMAVLQGERRYEILGQFDTHRSATQFIVQAGAVEPGLPPNFAKNGPEAVSILAVLTDQNLVVSPNGSFRITIGGSSGGPNHIVTPPGAISVGFRDTMADWQQQPARLSLRELEQVQETKYDHAILRQRVLSRLNDYVRTWASFPDHWFGGLKPNAYAGPIGREGAWGFVAGLRYRLAPDDAVVVTISRGGAAYLGFQVTDPWTIAADARKNLTSLNLAQSTPDADGNFTYVISPRDPGVANWLDTTGLQDGFGVIRWQGTPSGATADGLLRSFRIMKLADAMKLNGVARVSARERAAQLMQRAKEWGLRLR